MPTTAEKTGGTGESVNTGGLYPAWAVSFPNDASISFDAPDEQSEFFVSRNFSFSLPAGSTVTGILVRVRGNDDFVFDGNPLIGALGVYLWNNNNVIGSQKTAFMDNTLTDLGSSSDTWGLTLAQRAASVFNSSSFGVSFQAFSENYDVFPCAASIDYVTMTVTYQLGGNQIRQMVGGTALPWWLKRSK